MFTLLGSKSHNLWLFIVKEAYLGAYSFSESVVCKCHVNIILWISTTMALLNWYVFYVLLILFKKIKNTLFVWGFVFIKLPGLESFLILAPAAGDWLCISALLRCWFCGYSGSTTRSLWQIYPLQSKKKPSPMMDKYVMEHERR